MNDVKARHDMQEQSEKTVEAGSFVANKVIDSGKKVDKVTTHRLKSPAMRLNRSKNLSIVDQRAAMRLREIWNEYRKKHNVNQEEFAKKKLQWTQGNFSQYVTGGVPIGQKSLLRLAEALDCKPSDIREELQDMEMINRNRRLQMSVRSSLNYLKSLDPDMIDERGQKIISDLSKLAEN